MVVVGRNVNPCLIFTAIQDRGIIENDRSSWLLFIIDCVPTADFLSLPT